MTSYQPGNTSILSVQNLVVELTTPAGIVRVVDDVSFDVRLRELFGVVGESGSGKSMAMLAIMGLLPPGVARIAGGAIMLNGHDLARMAPEELRRRRGKDLAIIFQDPMTSFNPVMRVGTQIVEAIRVHNPAMGRREVRDRAVALLELVGIPDPGRRYRQYPLEFSGGMRQRAMIATAIANEPLLLIADEPTTALDVTIQAQVMEVLADVRARTGAATILITHDLGLIAEQADRVAVMYGGRIVETGDVQELFGQPRHPYTVGLLASRPFLDGVDSDLYAIPGQPPDVWARPAGCVFGPRCGMRRGRPACGDAAPSLRPVHAAHEAACHFVDETPAWSQQTHAGTLVDPFLR